MKNETRVLVAIFKDVATEHNANTLSKILGITRMGTLNILKKLEQQGILVSKKLGKVAYYRPDIKSDYARSYIRFALQKEAEQSIPRVKRWVSELRKFESSAEIGILFGSVISKEKFDDVDVLLVFDDAKIRDVQKILEGINTINIKKVHLVKQKRNDFKENLARHDKVVLEILRTGMVLFGYDRLIGVVGSVA
jgi:DNA-binding Lrp family transcriptional regulator